MSKQQLTIEHLAPYLPYQTPIMVETKKGWIRSPIHNLTHGTGIGTIGHLITSESFKIGLRPLSDLTKEIEHNGEKFVPLEVLNEKVQFFGNSYEIYIDDNNDVRLLANYHKGKDIIRGFDPKYLLMEWHFDVFGLIEKGLAININEVK